MEPKNHFVLISSSFKNNELLPIVHAHTGFDKAAQNKSPEFVWQGSPEKTKSFALVCHDPDAVGGTFIHWVLYNIPPSVTKLPAGLSNKSIVSVGLQGLNDASTIGYYGPRPPAGSGTHRYTFTIYALADHVPLKPGAMVDELTQAMQGHVLGKAQILGLVTAPA